MIYPSASELPENQLKFYVHFSTPMSQGDSHRHVRLLDASEKEVPFPFVDVGQELWDRRGTRITLLLDPGRIKRGLRPREEVGPIFSEGQTYALVIDDTWLDASGNRLASPFRKEFRIASPDETQPDPTKWSIRAPLASTRQPLQIEFDEPLDHAMLLHVISVVDSQGQEFAGEIQIDRQEREWRFKPRANWLAGPYQLLVDTTLEDLAGNSIGRPFEVDLFDEVDTVVKRETVSIPFVVR
jgi:hypothetical protein